MVRYFFLFLPYLFQLLLIVHIIKTGRDTYWIWLMIMLPYVSGIAYLIIEVLPGMLSKKNLYDVQDKIINIVKPNSEFYRIQRLAEESPTFNNLIKYADALVENQSYDKALEIYERQKKGVFNSDSELLYKLSSLLFKLGKYDEALECILEKKEKREKHLKNKKDLLMYLLIFEKLNSPEKIREEYMEIIEGRQDIEIDTQFLKYLVQVKDHELITKIFSRIHSDIELMRSNRITYDRGLYQEALRLEKEYEKSFY